MYIVDFTYDGRTLSSLGCGIGSLSTSNNENPTMGSELTFDTWTNTTSWKQGIVESKFETPLTFTFDIVKMNCEDINNYTFTENEIRDIMRWLNKTTYKKFKPSFDDGSYSDVYFMGTFTDIKAIHMVGEVVGFTLTLTTNSSFGYVEHIYTSDDNTSLSIVDDSDTFDGYIYPSKITIKCLEDGELRISNSADLNTSVIGECITGETIIMDCEHMVIKSDVAHPNLYNDFNYNYPRVFCGQSNEYEFSIPCEFAIEYSSIRKVGIMA